MARGNATAIRLKTPLAVSDRSNVGRVVVRRLGIVANVSATR